MSVLKTIKNRKFFHLSLDYNWGIYNTKISECGLKWTTEEIIFEIIIDNNIKLNNIIDNSKPSSPDRDVYIHIFIYYEHEKDIIEQKKEMVDKLFNYIKDDLENDKKNLVHTDKVFNQTFKSQLRELKLLRITEDE